MKRKIVVALLCLFALVAYQNCGKEGSASFSPKSGDAESLSIDPVTPNPVSPNPVSPTPVIPAPKVLVDAGSVTITSFEDDATTLALPAVATSTLVAPITYKWSFTAAGITSIHANKTQSLIFKDVSLTDAGIYTVTSSDSKKEISYKFILNVTPNTNKIFKTVLSWGPAEKVGPQFNGNLGNLLNNCAKAISEINALEAPIWFADEGIVQSPAKDASRKIWNTLKDRMPVLGYCGHLADTAVAVKSQDAIVDYILRLAKVYKGGVDLDKTTTTDNPGNPVNEAHLMPVLFAIDMVWAHLSPAEQTTTKKFLNDLNNRLYLFMAALNSNDDRLKNNWAIDAYVLRAYTVLILRDNTKILELQQLMNIKIKEQYTMPKAWKASTCKNLAAIGAYGSYDLQQRDAFLYHMKGLGMLTQLLALKPQFLNAATMGAIQTALDITKPYVLGTKKHNEFDCTTVEFDNVRRKAGLVEFSGPWDPARGKEAFRFGRISFPSTKEFTSAFSKEDYNPWIKVFVSGKGDIVAP